MPEDARPAPEAAPHDCAAPASATRTPARAAPAPWAPARANLHRLTLLSMLMADRGEGEILELAAATCETIAPTTRCSFRIRPEGWWPTPPAAAQAQSVVAFDAPGVHQLQQAPTPTYVVPVRCMSMEVGCLVVESATELTEDHLLPLQVLGQQLAVALDNARRLAREKATVSELRDLLDVHERLNQVAAAGGGIDEILVALSVLTGRPAVLEDDRGAVLAKAGEWPASSMSSARSRARLLDRLRREPRPVREGADLVALAGHHVQPAVMLRVHDPVESAGERDLMTMTYAATIIAMERARSAQVAEAEMRLRRDLVEELLLGLPEEAARVRADAVGFDLGLHRRVAVLQRPGAQPRPTDDQLLAVVRRTLRRVDVDALPVTRGTEVVCVADAAVDWSSVMAAIERDAAGGACQVGVGTLCSAASDYPASLRHARQALALGGRAPAKGGVLRFDDLGVYRLLALNNDPEELDHYIDQWLGTLIAYDQTRDADLVTTLETYLGTGGSIAATAEHLLIHRSTVKYRIQRMEQLTGYDLNDAGTRFALQLALHALRTRSELFSD